MKSIMKKVFALVLFFSIGTFHVRGQYLSSTEAFDKQGFVVSSGIGYMKELKSHLRLATINQLTFELDGPNTALIYWLNLSYVKENGWFAQIGYDWEKVDERDLLKTLDLKSLHLSLGKQLNFSSEKIRLYSGVSSIQNVTILYETYSVNGQTLLDKLQGSKVAHLQMHLGGDFLTRLTQKIDVGFRTRIFANFSDFRRFDGSVLVAIKL
ncbi:MAG: hypothetical protein Roseis2KO_39940 [Roseivirga sp.]